MFKKEVFKWIRTERKTIEPRNWNREEDKINLTLI